MKALVICPADRSEVESLCQQSPLAIVSILGKSLAQYWVEHLAALGAKNILVLASDRPEQIRAVLGDGSRWGVRLEIIPECDELTIAEARAKYQTVPEEWLKGPDDVILMETLPGLSPARSMLGSYEDWFKAVDQFLPRTLTPDRVGLREAGPGVWTGLRTRVSSSAKLLPPCWIGDDVMIGAGAVIGPHAIIESRVFVEQGAEVRHSQILAETYVGPMTEVHESLAFGNALMNWKTNSTTVIPDPFILSGLNQNPKKIPTPSFLGRLFALILFVVLAPVALLIAAKLKIKGQPAFRSLRGIQPNPNLNAHYRDTIPYCELAHSHKWIRRWPQLWNIVRGNFCWVGNRPLSASAAVLFKNDFERLWLAAPLGLFSLGDVQGAVHPASDEARAHASYYAVRRSWKMDISILRRILWAPKREETPSIPGEEYAMPFKADAVEGNRLT